MNTNMFDDYFTYKVKTIYDYSMLLTKIIGLSKNKLWHNRKALDESLNWIINDYLSNYDKDSYHDELIRCFINDKDISKYKINRELLSVINYFIDNGRAFEIKAYEKEIILAGVIVNIANNLDVSTSPYKINQNNYKTILYSFIEKFNKIPYFNLIDDNKKSTDKLLELIKLNVKKERKIFELLSSNFSFNKYVNVSKENRYYLTQYNYSIPGSKNIDSNAIKYVYEHENIDDRFVLISKDLIVTTIMKLLSVRKLSKVFFLPLKADIYQNEKIIKEVGYIFKNKMLSKYFKVLINYNDINDDILKLLNKYNMDYYIYCSKNTNIINQNIVGNNYLLSSDFKNLHLDFAEKLVRNNKKIIYEQFVGICTDKDLF